MEIYWLWLSMLPGVGVLLQKRLLQKFGSPADVYHAGAGELCSVEGLGKKLTRGLLEARSLDGAARLQEKVQQAGARLLVLSDPLYPAMVKSLPEAPAVLYYRGTLREQSCGVGIVGARRCTAYGKEVARQAATFLAEQGIPVISGMARGIDAYANTACLQAGGYTLAFLGCGVDVCFPVVHRDLMEAIVEHGAVISAYPPGTEARPEYFPQRNYLISAWSYRLLVVEAAQKSGSLITAGLALEMGRPVFAAPNSIFSRASTGTNALIAAGDAAIYLHPQQLVPQQQDVDDRETGPDPGLDEIETDTTTKLAAKVKGYPASAAAEPPCYGQTGSIADNKNVEAVGDIFMRTEAGENAASLPAPEQDILNLLADAGSDISAEELAARLHGGKKHFWETLAVMVLEGKVESLPGGRLRLPGTK